MNKEIALNAVGTGSLAALLASFGLTWWAVAMAFFGVALSLYFAGDKTPKGAKALGLYVFVMGVVSAVVAGSLPHLWELAGKIPVEPRAFLVGVLCNVFPPLMEWAKAKVVSMAKGATE